MLSSVLALEDDLCPVPAAIRDIQEEQKSLAAKLGDLEDRLRPRADSQPEEFRQPG